MKPRTPDQNRGFSLIEVLVVLGIITVLLAILLPAVERVRHQAYIDKCASNLRQIGLGFTMYENDNHGAWPRTVYDPATADAPVKGTGAAAPDPFVIGSAVQSNDLTAGLFLLLKTERLPTVLFICPYNDDTDFIADSANVALRSNFTDQKENLAYSFGDPYPSTAAVTSGYSLANRLSATWPIGSDKNPGRGQGSDEVYGIAPTSPKSAIRRANSPNHEQEGQNVLYGDGHVKYEFTPFVGMNQDNIFTAKDGSPPTVERSPADATDTILLPTDD
jgi:prepilin-type N-terminal cleavage/methylation domain-containing protein/prepilin-type processing-associated H-X9-DG protein